MLRSSRPGSLWSAGPSFAGSSAIGFLAEMSKPPPWYQSSQYRMYFGSSPCNSCVKRRRGVDAIAQAIAAVKIAASVSRRRDDSGQPPMAASRRPAGEPTSGSMLAATRTIEPASHHQRRS